MREEKTVLYSPLGLVYGTLYSAILLTRPSRVVVVTSPQAEVHLHAALDAARFYHTHFQWESHVLSDALAGFDEARRLAHRLTRTPGARNIINLSGGTTVLQDCVRSIADILRRETPIDDQNAEQSTLGSKPACDYVREIAVVDRRSAREQARSPLLAGEIIEVPPL
jgi:hypothetical protein